MPDNFGIIGIANSLVVYLILFSNLGFNTLGSRDIASDRSLIPKYVNNISTARFILAIFAFLIFVAIVLLLNKSVETKIVYLVAVLSIFSNALMLDWVFLGIERINVLAVRQVLTSLLNLAGIYIFIHSQSDTVLAMSIFTGVTFINALWIMILYMKEFGRISFELDFSFLKTLVKPTFQIAFY